MLEFIQWEDQRLAFGSFSPSELPSVPQKIIENGLDFTGSGDLLWKPEFLYKS